MRAGSSERGTRAVQAAARGMAARRQVARMRQYAAEEAAAVAAAAPRPVTPVTPSGNVRTVFGTARSSMMRRMPSRAAPASEPIGGRNGRGNGVEPPVMGSTQGTGRGGARAPAVARSPVVSRRRLSGVQQVPSDGEAAMRSPMGTGRFVESKSVG